MFLKHWDLSNFLAILSWPRKYTLLLLILKHYLSKVIGQAVHAIVHSYCAYTVTKRQLQSMCARDLLFRG